MLDQIGSAVGSVREVSEEGFGQRLIDSLVGVLFGVVLFFGSFCILWWNEGNVIAEKDSLDEMHKVLVKGSSVAPVKAHNGKLVHATGKLDATAKLGDAPYLAPGPYLALARHVEMYQWVEKSDSKAKTQLGGKRRTETNFSYQMAWADGVEDSSHFKVPTGHQNPELTVEAKNTKVQKPHFGKMDGADVLERLDANDKLPVTAAMLASAKFKPDLKNGMIYLRKKAGTTGDALGDVRISYKVIKAGPFSVIAKQVGKKYQTYVARNGKEKFLVMAGIKQPRAMIQSEKESASFVAVVLRFVGFFVMWMGLILLAGPITTLLDVIPFLGSAGRFVLGIIFFFVAAALSAVTIVVAMIAHHPIALAVFVLAAAGGGYLLYQKKQKAKLGNSTAAGHEEAGARAA